jgi:hypothetical protein
VGVLAHYFEEEGLATTQISLVREHTQTIRPPRALWVPFELGRPFGVPNDAGFQSRVLLRVLGLLEASEGPVLADFPEDAPCGEPRDDLLVCPVSFAGQTAGAGSTEQMLGAFRDEVSQMTNWYDLARRHSGRTTSGISGLAPDEIVEFLAAFVSGETEANPLPYVPVATALRMAVEDLKACYLEAVAAQPGQFRNSFAMADWFWGQTVAARVINALRELCLSVPDHDLQLLGKMLLVPRTQLYRFRK